jgi:DNA ligase D-like protein (predicted 3'-phosphoesterase)
MLNLYIGGLKSASAQQNKHTLQLNPATSHLSLRLLPQHLNFNNRQNMSATETTARFVVHKHQATHLHYDFRLELDNVLKSWAIPKEPPQQPGIKRLAVQVEDHQLSYINFQGTIPQGEYGAGTVEIWDKGTYQLKSRSPDKLVFTLNGQKLIGDYTLVKFKNDKNWLFFKNKPNKNTSEPIQTALLLNPPKETQTRK